MMRKKDKSKRKKALTAVGAVVAAGLTPGLIAATPVQTPSTGTTAAEVVAINGNTYDFDELYAMQQPGRGAATEGLPQVASRYGAPCSQYQQATWYGVQRPQNPPVPIQVVTELDTLQMSLIMYCAELIDADYMGIVITLDSDLTRELGMDQDQLKELQAEIKRRYDVELSYYRFYLIGQLNTLRLVSEYIYKLKHLWD